MGKSKKSNKIGDKTIKTECLFCSKLLRHAELPIHMNIHTGERPYRCDKCHVTFADYRQAWKHRTSVHLGKRYNCKSCNYSSTHYGNLHRHQKSCSRNNNAISKSSKMLVSAETVENKTDTAGITIANEKEEGDVKKATVNVEKSGRSIFLRPSQILNLVKGLDRVSQLKREKLALSPGNDVNTEEEKDGGSRSTAIPEVELHAEKESTVNFTNDKDKAPVTALIESPSALSSTDNPALNVSVNLPLTKVVSASVPLSTLHVNDEKSENVATNKGKRFSAKKFNESQKAVPGAPVSQKIETVYLPLDDPRSLYMEKLYASSRGNNTTRLPEHPHNLFFSVNGQVTMPVFSVNLMRAIGPLPLPSTTSSSYRSTLTRNEAPIDQNKKSKLKATKRKKAKR